MSSISQSCPTKVMSLTRKGIWPFLTVSAIIAGVLILGLGMLRLYSYNLECRIADIDQKLHTLEIEEIELTRNISQLRSPRRIFNVAKNELGMSSTSGVLYVNVAPDMTDGNREMLMAYGKNLDESKPLNPFVKKALAGD